MLRYDVPGPTPVRLAFTSVAEGNLALHVGDSADEVLERRRALEHDLGLAPASLQFMNQTHSTDLHLLPADGGSARDAAGRPGDAPWGPDADALLSSDGSVPLAVMVADCLPVLFAARGSGGRPVTAVAHAGRKGLLGGILQETVSGLRASGGSEIHAWIGPAICGACYEVPDDMAAGAERMLPGVSSRTSWGTASLDLPRAAERLLADLDVAVTATGVCTAEDPDYYSYRRDARTGRIAGLVWTPAAGTTT